MISLFKGKQTATLADVELKQQQTLKENGWKNKMDDSAHRARKRTIGTLVDI